MTVEDIISIAWFLGKDITEAQLNRLLAEIRQLSIADREYIYKTLNGGPLFTEVSMNRAEMGG